MWARGVIIFMLVFFPTVATGFGYAGYRLMKNDGKKIITPIIVDSDVKYEPNPRPMKLKITDDVKERTKYQVINHITQ